MHIYITPEQYDEAARNGINRGVLEGRIYRCGWDMKKAINTPVRERDKNNTKWRKIAEKNGISRETFHSRLHYGWTKKDAATLPVINNKIPNDIKILMDENDIKIGTYKARIKAGLSPLEAATKPVKWRK